MKELLDSWPLVFSLWSSGGIKNDWLLVLFKVSCIFTSILWDGCCLCTVFVAVRPEQIITSQREWWGRGCCGRTRSDDWWQREMSHGFGWGRALFPDSDPVGHTYSASHQKPLRLNPSQQRWRTDVENTSPGNIEERHTEMFYRDWTQVKGRCPRYTKIHTHTRTLNAAVSVII